MKKKVVLPLLIASLLFNGFLVFKNYFRDFVKQDVLEGRVVRVIDGDTFDLEGGIRVRLAGADAPEYPEGCLSLKAKERLGELILGKKVQIDSKGEDNFGRKVGFVKLEGLLIDKTMIEEGLAQASSGEHPQYGAVMLEAENAAKLAKRGIWSSQCAAGKDCVIKGNYRRDKDTRIYHLPECFNYDRIIVNEREGDKWFCTEKEAQAVGFRKSEDCP